MALIDGPLTDRAIRRLARRLGPARIVDLRRLIEADRQGRPPLPYQPLPQEIEARATALGCDAGPQPDILLGRDLIGLGLTPGKRVRRDPARRRRGPGGRRVHRSRTAAWHGSRHSFATTPRKQGIFPSTAFRGLPGDGSVPLGRCQSAVDRQANPLYHYETAQAFLDASPLARSASFATLSWRANCTITDSTARQKRCDECAGSRAAMERGGISMVSTCTRTLFGAR